MADSAGEDEYNETISKAANLMLAVDAMNRKKKSLIIRKLQLLELGHVAEGVGLRPKKKKK